MMNGCSVFGALIAVLLAFFSALIVREVHYFNATTLSLESFLIARIPLYVAWAMNVKEFPRNNSISAEYVRDLLKNASQEFPYELKLLPYVDIPTDIYSLHGGSGNSSEHHFIRVMNKVTRASTSDITDTETNPPAMLFLHGGCWSVGSVDAAQEVCARLAAETGFVVFCAAYRQAPEHPFPTPFYDAYASLRWVYKHAAEYGADPQRVYLAGESAGGNLAAAAAAYNLDTRFVAAAERVPVQGLLLVYPPLAVDFDAASYVEHGQLTGFLTARQGEYMWRMYAAGQLERYAADNYTFAPIHTPTAVLRQFPRTVMVLAKYDILHDDGFKFTQQLQSLGVRAQLLVLPSTIHGFFGKQSFSSGPPSLRQAVQMLLDDAATETAIDAIN